MVYVPYHPEDRVAVMAIKPLPEAAARLGVELVLNEVRSPEEVMAAIETLPKDAAILFIPTPGLTPRMSAVRMAGQLDGAALPDNRNAR